MAGTMQLDWNQVPGPFQKWWAALENHLRRKRLVLAAKAWDAALDLAAQTAWDAVSHHDAQENILALKVR